MFQKIFMKRFAYILLICLPLLSVAGEYNYKWVESPPDLIDSTDISLYRYYIDADFYPGGPRLEIAPNDTFTYYNETLVSLFNGTLML